jgi:hypothetical protein
MLSTKNAFKSHETTGHLSAIIAWAACNITVNFPKAPVVPLQNVIRPQLLTKQVIRLQGICPVTSGYRPTNEKWESQTAGRATTALVHCKRGLKCPVVS